MLANTTVEQMNRESIQQLQLTRLQKQVKWALEKSSFNRDKLIAAGVDKHTIQSLEDIKKLPTTTAKELRVVSPYDIMTLPINGMLRVASYPPEMLDTDCKPSLSSGKESSHETSPAPARVASTARDGRLIKVFTGGDIAQNMELLLRTLKCYGVNRTSMVGLFGPAGHTGLLDVQYALEGLGATVMLLGNDAAIATGMLEQLYVDILVTDLAGLKILDAAAKRITRVLCLCNFAELECYKNGVNASSPAYEKQDDTEEQQLIWLLYSPELGAAGILFDCLESDSAKGKSFHINEDLFYPELSDTGELLLTTLNAEAMPVLRFKTGLHGKLCYGICECGRSLTIFQYPKAR